MRKQTRKFHITENTKNEIIEYCFYIYGSYIDNTVLTKYELSHAIFLELLFNTACDTYQEEGDFELYKDEIGKVFVTLRISTETLKRFLKDEVELLAIDKNELYQFNLDPKRKLKYNRATQTWDFKTTKVKKNDTTNEN